jgi:hypothetical protein
MSPTRLGGNILFFLSQIVISSYVEVTNTYINDVINIFQTIFSNNNISKHIACIHYTINGVDNHGILSWMETPRKILAIQRYLMDVITISEYS